VICAPSFVAGKYTGKYNTASEKFVDNNKWNILLGDLADYVLKAI